MRASSAGSPPSIGDARASLQSRGSASGPYAGVVLEMDAETFERLVAEALDGVPTDLMALLQNVVVLTADEPPPDEPDLLGLYEGIPLTERDGWYSGVLPDRITIFRGPTLRHARTWDEAVSEVRITVVHEIAHHFGIDDDRLHELGYG